MNDGWVESVLYRFAVAKSYLVAPKHHDPFSSWSGWIDYCLADSLISTGEYNKQVDKYKHTNPVRVKVEDGTP